ncbi:MAG: hypothetical protein ACLFPQ_04515 [Candidatus Woesearchaeota archaeon]
MEETEIYDRIVNYLRRLDSPKENDPISSVSELNPKQGGLWRIVGGIVGENFPNNRYEINEFYNGRMLDAIRIAVQMPEFYLRKDISQDPGDKRSGYVAPLEIKGLGYDPELDTIVLKV